jgi:signal transduction histidine kinase
VLRSTRPDFKEVTSGLQTIDDSTAHLVRLIDELLDLMRLRMGHAIELDLAPTDLIEIVRRLAGEHQKLSPGQEIAVETDLESIVGEWDRPRIERVVSNLVSNAVKYGARGREITITVGQELRDERPWAVLIVRNYGLGIPPLELDRVFDAYYRASNVSAAISGTGVGLAGARHIVEQHGGEIGVESVVGGTTTFTVGLPMAQDRVERRRQAPAGRQ